MDHDTSVGAENEAATEKSLDRSEHELTLLEAIARANLPDSVLDFMVRSANDHGFEAGVTLALHGLLVTGTLVGGRKFFNGVSAHALEVGTGTGVEVFGNAIRRFGEDYPDPAEGESSEAASGEDDLELMYFHLQNARFWRPGTGGGPSPDEGVWFRGRLSAVDGFMLGEVGRRPSD